jgi:hypothetical protein
MKCIVPTVFLFAVLAGCVATALANPITSVKEAIPETSIDAEDDCTFDQQRQEEVLREMSRIAPGAALDIKHRQVSWRHPVDGCVFRSKPVTHSGPCRSLIPEHAGR